MNNDTVIKIENVYSWLITSDLDIKKLLHDKLRFRPKNYWHNVAYQKKKWDGFKDFFDDKSGKFLTGILPEVEKLLQVKKKEYLTLDNRGSFEWLHQSIGDDFLDKYLPPGQDPIVLHDFQPDLANQCFQYNRGIVQAPCGAGKTFILVSLLKSLPPKTPTLFLTKNAQLVDQNWQEMKKWNVPNLGRWYDGHKEPNYVMCATVHGKTFESLAQLLPKFKVLFVDEAHDCMSDIPVAAYRKMQSALVRIGFSATPFRWDKKKIDQVHKWSVKGHFGPLFKTSTTESGFLTTKDLQERNILSNSDCSIYTVDKPNLAYEPYQDAVKLGIEQNFHFHAMVKTLARSCPGRTLIVVERIEQGEYLKSLMPEAIFMQGKTSLRERAPVINSLRAGDKFIGIVMRQIITAGINIKIHDLINAAGGEGAHNIIQLMGRGLRTADDKNLLRYHDFLFMINDYLLKHSEWRIEVLKKEGHNVTMKPAINI